MFSSVCPLLFFCSVTPPPERSGKKVLGCGVRILLLAPCRLRKLIKEDESRVHKKAFVQHLQVQTQPPRGCIHGSPTGQGQKADSSSVDFSFDAQEACRHQHSQIFRPPIRQRTCGDGVQKTTSSFARCHLPQTCQHYHCPGSRPRNHPRQRSCCRYAFVSALCDSSSSCAI